MKALDWQLVRTLFIFLLTPNRIFFFAVLGLSPALLVEALGPPSLGYDIVGWKGVYLVAWYLSTVLLLVVAPTQLMVLCTRKTWLLLGNTLELAFILVAALVFVWTLALVAPLTYDRGFAVSVSVISAVFFSHSLFCWAVLLRRFEVAILILLVALAGSYSGLLPLGWFASNWWLGFAGIPAALLGWWIVCRHSLRAHSAPVDVSAVSPFPIAGGCGRRTERAMQVAETGDPLASLLTPWQTFFTWRLTSLLDFLAVATLSTVLLFFAFGAPSLAQVSGMQQMVLAGCLMATTLFHLSTHQQMVVFRLRLLWLYGEHDRQAIVRLWTSLSRGTLIWKYLSLTAIWLALEMLFSPGQWLIQIYFLTVLWTLLQAYSQVLALQASAWSRLKLYNLDLLIWASLCFLLWWSNHPAAFATVFLPTVALTLWLRQIAVRRLQYLDFSRAVV